jgi:hypothetical protein
VGPIIVKHQVLTSEVPPELSQITPGVMQKGRNKAINLLGVLFGGSAN